MFVSSQINFWENHVTFRFLHDLCHKQFDVVWLIHGSLVNELPLAVQTLSTFFDNSGCSVSFKALSRLLTRKWVPCGGFLRFPLRTMWILFFTSSFSSGTEIQVSPPVHQVLFTSHWEGCGSLWKDLNSFQSRDQDRSPLMLMLWDTTVMQFWDEPRWLWWPLPCQPRSQVPLKFGVKFYLVIFKSK